MFVQIDNVKIFYETKGNGMPVIYVHGNFASSKWFEKVMDVPSSKVYAIDLPNFGNSGWIEEISIEKYSYYLWKFVENLKIEKSILVGHSLGGAVVLKCVIDHPENFSGMFLVDPAPANGLKTLEVVYSVLESFKNHPDFLEKSLEGIMPTKQEMAKILVEEGMKMNPKAFSGNARALERYDYSKDLSKINIPVEVLWGTLDPIVSRNDLEKMVTLIPKAKFDLLEGIGHSLIVENPKIFTELLVKFENGLRKQ
jgi:branched-chain amino acid transport system permease protein